MLYSVFIQSLAIVAVILFIISFHAKSRKNILLLQLLSILIWAAHFYLLSAWTGAVLITLNGAITILFLFKTKNKWLKNPLVLYFGILLFVIFTWITWGGFYSLFSLFAVILIVTAKWQDNPRSIRLISFPASIFWIVYDSSVGAYGSIVAEVLIIISILISLRNSK
jgi:hypothetical protein